MCTTGSKSTTVSTIFARARILARYCTSFSPSARLETAPDGAKCLVGYRNRLSPLNHNMWQQGPIAHFLVRIRFAFTSHNHMAVELIQDCDLPPAFEWPGGPTRSRKSINSLVPKEAYCAKCLGITRCKPQYW